MKFMRFLQRMNQLTVLLAAYLAGLVVYIVPYGWLGLAGLLIGMGCKRGYQLTSHGSAAWAKLGQVRHMLDGYGIIIGYMAGKIGRIEGVRALFKAPPREAVKEFLESCQGVGNKPQNFLRLTDSIHTMVVAPTNVGKGVSCVIPFLLTCPDSCVVVDFKGENALLTAEHRAKEFGHKIVILDPFEVVTE